MEIDKYKIGEYILLERRKLKLSQTAFGNETGISKTTLQHIESGQGNIGINIYIKVLKKLQNIIA